MIKTIFEKYIFAIILLGLLTYFISMMFIDENKQSLQNESDMKKDVMKITESFMNVVLFTIIGSIIFIKISLFFFLVGILLHRFFCLKTTLDKMLFSYGAPFS